MEPYFKKNGLVTGLMHWFRDMNGTSDGLACSDHESFPPHRRIPGFPFTGPAFPCTDGLVVYSKLRIADETHHILV